MAEPTRSYFAAITDIAENCLNKIRFKRIDVNADRSVWEVHGNLSECFDVRLKEIFTQKGRMYSYYILCENEVVIGFDNYPDTRLLQEKYGSKFVNHIAELIPHRHGRRKMSIELTENMSVKSFFEYLPATDDWKKSG